MVDRPTNDGLHFERETALVLARLGWEVNHTAISGDGGADLIARLGEELLVVQCKDWSNQVGTAALMEANFGRSLYRAKHAMVVAKYGFTSAAKEHARRLSEHGEPIHLLTLSELAPGCIFDRRPQGLQLRAEKRLAQRQDEWRNSEAQREQDWQILLNRWEQYDKSTETYKISIENYNKTKLPIACAWAFSLPVLHMMLAARPSEILAFFLTVLGGFIGRFHGFILRRPDIQTQAPEEKRPPEEFRRADMPDFRSVVGREIGFPPWTTIAGSKNRRNDSARADAGGSRAETADNRVSVRCLCCRGILRLPAERSGTVVCPLCRQQMWLTTRRHRG